MLLEQGLWRQVLLVMVDLTASYGSLDMKGHSLAAVCTYWLRFLCFYNPGWAGAPSYVGFMYPAVWSLKMSSWDYLVNCEYVTQASLQHTLCLEQTWWQTANFVSLTMETRMNQVSGFTSQAKLLFIMAQYRLSWALKLSIEPQKVWFLLTESRQAWFMNDSYSKAITNSLEFQCQYVTVDNKPSCMWHCEIYASPDGK